MNKITQYVPLHLSFFLVIGILFGYYSTINLNAFVRISIIVVFLLGILFYLTKRYFSLRWSFQFMSYVLIFLIGTISISFHNYQNLKDHYLHHISDKNRLVFQIDKTLKPTKYQYKYYAQVLQIDSVNCKGKILLNISKDSLSTALRIGDTFTSISSFKEINKPLNPHSFDYNNYLKKQGIIHQLSLQNSELLQLPIKSNNLKAQAGRLREMIQYSLQKHSFQDNELAIINAIVLGQRQNISRELLDSYAGAGAIHILAVSGLHVGILFLLLGFIFSPLEKIKYGNHFKMLLIVLILWGFALLTGLSGSVVRAVTMFTFIAVGMAINNQRSSVLHALITSFFVLTLIHPLYLFDVGFQMSYTAVLGIVLLYPKFNILIKRPNYLLPRKVWQLLCVSLSATLGTFPISLYYFHQFPSLFFVSNIVIVPFLGIIMGIGIFVVILDLLQILPDIIVQLYGFVLSYMNTFIEWISHQEAFLFKNISFSIVALIASYLIIAMGYRWWSDRKIPKLAGFLVVILMSQCVFLVKKNTSTAKDELIIFHKSKESILGIRQGKHLNILHTFDSITDKRIRLVDNYRVGQKLAKPIYIDSIPSVIDIQKHRVLRIDSLGVYQNLSFKPDIVLLSQSPKINIERLINSLEPQVIIADGSNYKSYVSRWRKTCLQNKTTFHYTGSDGAYSIN